MAGEKIQEAQSALDRFVFELLDKQDEIFLYRFSNYPTLLQGWTTDRQLLTRAIGRISANGGTAMYDTIAEAIPLAQRGQNRKKALLLISDGNDTASSTGILPVKQLIRESEVLVYAIGIDGESSSAAQHTPPPRAPMPMPFPFPGGRAPAGIELAPAAAERRRRTVRPEASERRSRQRRRAARLDRRQRRAHRDHSRRARSQPGDGRHRGRIEPAVLSRLSRRSETRTVAGTRSGSKCATAHTGCAPVAGTSPAKHL